MDKNPVSAHLPQAKKPRLREGAYVHPQAFVCGDVSLGKEVFVAPFASIRADEGSPFFIGDFSNIQDAVVLHALETLRADGTPIEEHLMEVAGRSYSIYIGQSVSLAHQAHVHGPSLIEDETFVGMQAFVCKSRIGKRCVLEPGCRVMGVTVPDGRYIPMGTVVRDQAEADALPRITEDYAFCHFNDEVVRVNRELARAYSACEPASVS